MKLTGSLQVVPECKTKHLVMKSGLIQLYKIHPKVVACEDPKMRDDLFGQISLSFRILLYHFKKCAEKKTNWQRCLGSYKENIEKLEPVVDILRKIKPSIDDEQDEEEEEAEARVVEVGSLDPGWQALGDDAPVAAFWPVLP